jgi:hypothetical protein
MLLQAGREGLRRSSRRTALKAVVPSLQRADAPARMMTGHPPGSRAASRRRARQRRGEGGGPVDLG